MKKNFKIPSFWLKTKSIKKLACFPIICSSIFFFILCGYYITYQLFFLGTGLEDLAIKKDGRQYHTFKYNNVHYFKGLSLHKEEDENSFSTEVIEIYPPSVMDKNKKFIEFFIRIESLTKETENPDENAGTLVITEQAGRISKTSKIVLKKKILQRHTIPWETYSYLKNSTTVTFIQEKDNKSINNILFATEIHLSFFRNIAIWGLLAFSLLVLWVLLTKRIRSKRLYLIIVTIIILYYFRSGAFISNEYFPKTAGRAATAKTAFGHAKYYYVNGCWKPNLYKPIGTKLIPFFILFLEPEATKTETKNYMETYPAPRYTWFIFECIALCFLIAAMYKYLSRMSALLFPAIYISFFPFLIDIYNMEGDAYSIVYMMFLTGLLL